jgi:hypothetical protein
VFAEIPALVVAVVAGGLTARDLLDRDGRRLVRSV